MEQDNNQNKNEILLKILTDIKNNLENAINVLGGSGSSNQRIKVSGEGTGGGKIIEGVFSGDKMIGSDGEAYGIPQNYASKSKLVEGDILKLTVTPGGNFIYKQVGPVPRKRLTGELIVDEEQDEYWVASESEKWRVLKASITYFKGQTGDKVAFLVPQDALAKWAAVENVMKNDAEI